MIIFFFLYLFYSKLDDLDEIDEEILICERKLSLSAAFPKNDVFQTFFLPGLQTKTEQNLTIIDSFFNNRVLIWHGESNKTEDKTQLNTEIKIKSLPLTKNDINFYKQLKYKEIYANIQIDGIKYHIKMIPNHQDTRLFQQENDLDIETFCIYTKFHIILHEDGKRCFSFYFVASSEEIGVLEEGKSIEYTFFIERMPIIPTIPKRISQSSFEYLFISILLFIALFVIISIQFLLRKKIRVSVIDYLDIWKITPHFKESVIFSGFGLECLFYVIFLYLTKDSHNTFEDVLLQNFVLGLLISTIWINVLGTFFHINFSFKQSLVPLFFTTFVIILPQQIITLICRYKNNSMIGMNLFKTIGIDLLILSTSSFVVNGAMMTSKILRLPFQIETNDEQPDDLNLIFDENGTIQITTNANQQQQNEINNEKTKEKIKNSSTKSRNSLLILLISSLIYCSSISYISKQFIKHLIDVIFCLGKFHLSQVIAGVLYAFAIGGLTGCAISLFSVKKRIKNWMDQYFYRFIISFITIFSYFIITSNNYEFGSKCTFMHYYYYVIVFSLFLSSIGLFSSVLCSTISMNLYFAQNKIN